MMMIVTDRSYFTATVPPLYRNPLCIIPYSCRSSGNGRDGARYRRSRADPHHALRQALLRLASRQGGSRDS